MRAQRCLTTYKVPSLKSVTEHPDVTVGERYIKRIRSKTQLPRPRVLTSRLVQTNSVEATTNETNHRALSAPAGSRLHPAQP